MYLLPGIKRINFILLIASIMTFFFISCNEEIKDPVTFAYDPEIVPMMSTDSVTMLISDSGVIRYKMITKTWDVYDQAKDPFWLFPNKLYLEQYDTLFNVVAVVKADTAWNYTRQKLWKFKGNVFIRNKVGETFTSEELFWNEYQNKVYSNKYVEINRPEKGILRVEGFESNQQMTEYKFFKVRNSEIYVKEDKEGNEENIE